MQAIVTKFIGPTNHRGARVKATAQAGSITIEWDHARGIEENHDAAAVALCVKVGWTVAAGHAPTMIRGTLPDGQNVYVTPREFDTIATPR